MRRTLLVPLVAGALCAGTMVGCSDYKLNSGDKGNGGADDSGGDGGSGVIEPPPACDPAGFPAETVGLDDTCPREPKGGFTPIPEWTAGAGKGCLNLPTVGDLDRDGFPEVVATFHGLIENKGTLTVLDGRTGALKWEDPTADIGMGSAAAIGDIDHDGYGEIIAVRMYETSLFTDGDYTVLRYEHDGTLTWESEHFIGLDFDWASAPVLSDMDHDGTTEIVVGRVIFDPDGNTLGVGQYGRGSYGVATIGGLTVSESSVSAVVDLDLDGEEEVIVGNARYDKYGEAIWHDDSQDDAMIGIANLDDDIEGEIVGISYNTIRAIDTDGRIMWGPTVVESANILSPPAIADLDDDGYPEIVTAGGNNLVVFHHDGTELWRARVTDKSGATGASIFDFEGDGIPEVVYIDEVEMVVYEGPTGRIKFYSTEHASNTMMDYPVIADVDADDHAEILVCHNGTGVALTAFGELTNTWADARQVWNQHAFSITNVEDDLSIPVSPVPGFVDSNTWHSAIATDTYGDRIDMQAEVLEVCTDECAEGIVYVTARATNRGDDDVIVDTQLTLYAEIGGGMVPLDVTTVPATLASGWSSDAVVYAVNAADLDGADAIWAMADDDGSGAGMVTECAEDNNGFRFAGPFCSK